MSLKKRGIPLEGFDTILIEGIFYRDETSSLMARAPEGKVSAVDQVLGRLENLEIQFAMHHLPEMPLIPDRWGGGCCMWQASGKCPAGHHENPSFLLSIAGRGVLRRQEDGWHLATFEGEDISIPLHQMEGHMGRIAAVTIIDLNKLRDSISSIDLEKIDTVGIQATQLQEVLGQLQEAMKGIK